MSAVAASDALRLVSGISEATAPRSRFEVGATEQEVHGLAYLGCQLATWVAPDLSWQYEFHTTTQAEPFAPALSIALRTLRENGMVEDSGALLRTTPTGAAFTERLKRQKAVQERSRFIQAALDTTILLPIPLVLQALSKDPTVARAATMQTLLDETAVNVLAEYYQGLRSTAGANATLLSLTELWLQYLLASGRREAA